MNTDKQFDRIEKYFEGQMSATETAAFEAEMARNPRLKTTVENYEIADNAIELLVENSLRAELDDLRQAAKTDETMATIKQPKNEAKIFKMRTLVRNLSIAASIALLIGFFTFQFVGSQYSNESLMQSNYGDVSFSTLRGTNPDNVVNTQLILGEATIAWEEKNYDRVITLVKGISTTDDYFAKAQYILGHSWYQKGDYKNAQTAFDTAATQEDEKYTEKAQWYAILAAIGNKDSVLNIQKRLDVIIADRGHGFEEKAKTLKADLESFWR